MFAGTEQWKIQYITHCAFSMTLPELSEALNLSHNHIRNICKALEIRYRSSPHRVHNRKMKDSSNIIFIHRASKMNEDKKTATTFLMQFNRIRALSDFYYVEDIAEMLCLSIGNIVSKIRRMKKKPKFRPRPGRQVTKTKILKEKIKIVSEIKSEQKSVYISMPHSTERLIKHIPMKKEAPFTRPASIYTNLPSPYGIATELHKQGGKYVES